MTTSSRPRRPRSGTFELDLDGLTHGGEAVGRLPDGKACFVPYAIPGERVRVEVATEHKRWARGRLVEVLRVSPDRVEPPCPYFGPGRCGGCQLQHVTHQRQLTMKRRVVVEQLERIGRFVDPPVGETVAAGAYGYRIQARFAVDDEGRLGFHRAASDALIPIDHCPLLDDATQALRASAGDAWRGVSEVGVRTGAGTDSEALVVRPGPDPLPPLPAGTTPVALQDAFGDTVALRGEPSLQHEVAGLRLATSPTSFFQANPAGAAALVDLVTDAAAIGPAERVLDLYAGVGLFAAAFAARGAAVVAVEGRRASCDDARANLADADVEVRCATVESAVDALADADERFAAVVLNPPRRGAGPALSARLAAFGAPVIVYVSCDPASLARDARALVDAGYALQAVTPVDQFAQTASIESVAAFVAVTDRD